MTPHLYSSLLRRPGSIRLLRLYPPDDDASTIRCEMSIYSLGNTEQSIPRYEALSYVWGDRSELLPITIDGCVFNITANLHAALLHLRSRAIEWIWVDAICINQEDRQERGHQVRHMAKIYGRAHRVIVWLGTAENNSDRVFEDINARRKSWSDHADSQASKDAVVHLLQRSWFQRIWILQEVAAARRILVVCGSAEADGYRFCVGLKSMEPLYKHRLDLINLIRSVTYLMRQANFRPTSGIDWTNMSFLAIRPLGQLLDMYHAHRATERHDKVYALLGMSSDALDATDLLPDYDLPWYELVKKLMTFILGPCPFLGTWNNQETIVFLSKGTILGKVSSIQPSSGWGDTHKVNIMSTRPRAMMSPKVNWNYSLTLHNSAKSIQTEDLVFLPENAAQPMIIRTCKDYFSVVMIAVTPPEHVFWQGESLDWPNLILKISPLLHGFFLVWDWMQTPDIPWEYDALVSSENRPQEITDPGAQTEAKVTRLENMGLILVDLGQQEEAKKRIEEATEICERVPRNEFLGVLDYMVELSSVYRNQSQWKGAEELEVQRLKDKRSADGENSQDTLASIANLLFIYGRIETQIRQNEAIADGKDYPEILPGMASLVRVYRGVKDLPNLTEALLILLMKARKSMIMTYSGYATISISELASVYFRPGVFEERVDIFNAMASLSVKSLVEGLLRCAVEMRQNDPVGTREIFGAVLDLQTIEIEYGADHPETLDSWANLARIYWKQGRWREAEELDVRIVATMKRNSTLGRKTKERVEMSSRLITDN